MNIRLEIDGHDYTNCIVADTYSINEADVYNTFVDGNYVTHRSLVRTKVSGSVTLHFRDADDITNWNALVNAKLGSTALHSVSCYVNNTGKSKLLSAFLTYAMVHKPRGSYDTAGEFSLTIEEA